MHPDVYKRTQAMLSFHDDSNSIANIVGIGEKDGGGGGGGGGGTPSSSLDSQIIAVNNTQQSQDKNIRLPSTLRPLHYVVRVQPFINGNYSIHGSVQIDIEVLKVTSNITLHLYEMKVNTQNIQVRCYSD